MFKTLVLSSIRKVHPLVKFPFHRKQWKLIRLSILLLLDTLCIAFAYWISFVLRLESASLGPFLNVFFKTLPVLYFSSLIVYAFGGLYREVWKYANARSAIRIFFLTVLSVTIAFTIIYVFGSKPYPPRSLPFIYLLVSSAFLGAQKFSWRFYLQLRDKALRGDKPVCLVYGAGSAAELLTRHISANPAFPYKLFGFIDDDKNKKGRTIHGVKVLGSGGELESIIRKSNAKVVIIAIHAASGKIVRDIFNKCNQFGVKTLIMPELSQALSETMLPPRTIELEDLISRDPRRMDLSGVKIFFDEKIVLVTGAGGSIGSEVCRQIMMCNPAVLLLFDVSEANLYHIHLELTTLYADKAHRIKPVLGSIVDQRVLERIVSEYNPYCIIHAAAYKHVPLVEQNPTEAIINNVLGTKNLAQIALKYHVPNFVLISSDKAVNPTNIMGATKRCCELLIQSLQEKSPHTKFSAVRFGNVLGSSGSVIPLFLDQIKKGGPVTVTHPDVTRYFMLTKEAVALVLQAACIAKGGEIFVLNMGDPIKIYDLARELISLSGKQPDEDIEIIFTGLRPGEKLYEEIVLQGTEKAVLRNDIYVLTTTGLGSKFELEIDEIILAAKGNHQNKALDSLRSVANLHFMSR